MDKTVLDFVMIASVVIGYFIGIALITTTFYKNRANNYLALSLFIIASLTFFEWPNAILETVLFQLIINFRLDFLFAASLFTYFLIQIKHQLIKHVWFKLIYLPFVISVSLELYLFLFDRYGSELDVLLYFIKDFASIGFNILMILWGKRLVQRADAISEDKKRWLLRLNRYICITIGIWVLTRIEFFLFHSFYSAYLLQSSLSLFLWWVLYYGIFRLQLITQKEELHALLGVQKNTGSKTNLPAKKINNDKTDDLISELYRVMEEEELYKNPLLSRWEIAARLGISEGNLSMIINQNINKSVIQFVNDYRVETAKDLLHDSRFDKYSVEAVGMEAGFKSKSAFYTVFKSSLAMSPGAYRKLPKKS